jgi:hypothetical protein
MDWIDLAQDRDTLTGPCGHDNKPPGLHKALENSATTEKLVFSLRRFKFRGGSYVEGTSYLEYAVLLSRSSLSSARCPDSPILVHNAY